jgi:hypothetical protein
VRLIWRGPTKTSPNRRYRATPEYRFDEHGDCWLGLTVHDRAGEAVTQGGPWDCYPEFGYCKKSAQSLRWDGSSSVRIDAWPANTWDVAPHHTINVPG